MEIFPDKRNLIGLVAQAHEGTICLPNFQRDFVWARGEVADLLRSVIRGYYIGSLLLLRCEASNPPFAPVYLRGAKQGPTSPQPSYLILDGQQRLTSLIYALTAPDLSLKDSSQRRYFFVDLDKLLSDPESDDIIIDRTKKELRGLDTPAEQYARRMLPCTSLFTPQAFYQWLFGYESWAESTNPALYHQYRAEWRLPWDSAVKVFQDFQAPLIELPSVSDSDPGSIGRICAIFEKLNSTGVELSVYDLLTARLYKHDIRLHALWDESCSRHQRLNSWSRGKADEHKFGVLVLRTLALLRGLDPKPSTLIELKPDGFEDDWRRAAAAIERALELITHTGPDGFGVFDEKWLPGFGLIPILAALRAAIEDRHLGQEERQDLRRWYWCNVFLERYSSAVESKSRKDYQEMLAWWTVGDTLRVAEEPAVFQEARERIGAPNFRIRTSASYASSVYSGVFCLLALYNARDWREGEEITLQELNDHHIFPRAYLQRHGITRRVDVNSITNRTLISDRTNQIIKAKAPATYCADSKVFSSGLTPALLEPHFIDTASAAAMQDAIEGLSVDQARSIYHSFREAREAAIIHVIRQACGITTSSPIDSDEPEEAAADIQADMEPIPALPSDTTSDGSECPRVDKGE